jgi:predicted TIM-barrel enzyme
MATTERPKHVEMNCTTGEVTERFWTDEEIASAEAEAIIYSQKKADEEAEAERIATLKESAKAKLIAGEPLTEEEAATIVL